MEMKLSGKRIKELRLKLSWSQEKLAEEAGLNTRTVQRAETDGSASLRTRLQLAAALQVRPEELDAEPSVTAAPDDRPSVADVYYLAILLLVSIGYVAAQPAYFSLSVTKFNYQGMPWHGAAAWWIMTLSLWALLCLPILGYFRNKHRTLFLPYLAASCLGMCLTVLRLWQASWVSEGLTALVSLSGLALLLSLYFPRLDTARLRHAACMVLGAYVFIWCLHDLGSFAVTAYVGVRDLGDDLSVTMPLWYVRGTVLRNLADLLPLIPVTLVLALSLSVRPARLWRPKTPVSSSGLPASSA